MKRKLITCIAIVMGVIVISVSAFEAGIFVTLDSSQPVSEQANALREYVDKLPQEDREAWRDELKLLANDTIMNFAELPPGSEDDTVYIADSGSRYHLHIGCRGLNSALTVSKVLKEVAIGMGRSPCKICYPHGD